MDYGPDSEPNTDVRFLSRHFAIFTPDDSSFPLEDCSLVAAAAKFGRIFVGCGKEIKVFDSRSLCEEKASEVLATIYVGAQVTHVATSCDGLTLLVAILHNQSPHALFYEIRLLVPGCGELTPFVSVSLGGSDSRVHAVAWNPTDPSSVAVALSPSSLTLLTIKETHVEVKSENIEARALGWSPKGKQLTVGLVDGTLKLFKPDLTGVRSVQRPPMDEAGAVLSVTWFTNTEFFIGYKSSVEEGAHVLMYVNAPKAKESKFVAYEYVCNYNQGPRQAMFYPFFFPEWSLLCMLSSRAVPVAVLGRPAGGVEGWCEYEIEEGCAAAVHNVSITQETYPLGLAVDFTSKKTFTGKDNKVFGPCPVLYTLSTGGELNLFYILNDKPALESLTKPQESLPSSGHRTSQQYGGVASYSVGSTAAPTLSVPSSVPQTSFPTLPASKPSGPLTVPEEKTGDTKFTFSLPVQATSPFSPSPIQNPSASLKPPQTQSSALNTSLFPKAESTSFFGSVAPSESAKPAISASTGTPKPSQSTISQDFKFPSFPIPQHGLTVVAPSIGTLAETKAPPIIPIVPKPPDVKPTSVASPPSPSQASPMPSQAFPVVSVMDETLLSTIETAKTNFERELQDHLNIGDLPRKIGSSEEMGSLRCSLREVTEWVDQMGCTTSELKGEVGQLHSEVLEGFTLTEEAEMQVNKTKNPRCTLQPQSLDPHSRKQMDEIRSLYQYLQSQLAEIDTRLHLDWAAYRNERNKKKRKELPASETLYQALKKCQYARKVCERRVDALCERIKDLHLHSLSGMVAPQNHQEDDEILASLEKSLRETSISVLPTTSPFKMLSPGKQKSLQKVLSQRNFIPLRKCSNLPRMNLSSLDNLSVGYDQEGSHLLSSSAQPPSTPKNGASLESFGPQTFSTPLHTNQASVSPLAREGDITSEASLQQEVEETTSGTPQPQYEDITPPQTPDNRLSYSAKPASPLRALSRLVSEVPTTGASETKASGMTLLSDGKTAFRGFVDGGSSPGGLKAPVTVASGPLVGAFKPVTSAPLSKTTLAFSFTQFVPPNTASSSQSSVTQQSLSQGLGSGSSPLFKPPSAENTSFSQSTKSEGPKKTESKNTVFSFKPPVSIIDTQPQFTDKPENPVLPSGKMSDHSLPLVSSVYSHLENITEAEGNGFTSNSKLTPQTFTSTQLPTVVADSSSSSSSSSTDSDTASNTTVIGDSVSVSGASDFPEGPEPLSEGLVDAVHAGDQTIQVASLSVLSPDLSTQKGSSSSSVITPNSQPSTSSNLFTAQSGNLFRGVDASMFGGASTGGFLGTKTSVASGSQFVSPAATTTTSGSLFTAPATTSGGVFGATTTTTPGSLFNTLAPVSGSLFGAKTMTTSAGGLFGMSTTAATTTTTASGNLFGMTSTTTTGSIFGNTSSSGSIFGAAKPSSTGNIFGSPNTSDGKFPGTTGSIFASSATAVTGDAFGSTAAATETTAATTTTAAANIVTTTTAGSTFGILSATTPAAGSIFRSTTSANTGSIFESVTTSGSVFGTSSKTSGSIFGLASTVAAGSIFVGSTTNTSTGNILGSTAISSVPGSIFGSSAKTSAATGNIFGSPVTTAGTGNLFGGSGTMPSSSTEPSSTNTSTSATSTTTSTTTLATGLFSSSPTCESPSFSISFGSGGVGSLSSTAATSRSSTLFSSQTATTTTGISFTAGGIFSTPSATSSSASISTFTGLATSSSAFTSPGSSATSTTTTTTIATTTITTTTTAVATTTATSVFGQGSQGTSGSVFGSVPSPQGSLFGGGNQSEGTFGTSTPSTGIFGGTGGQSVFGNTSGSIFGQTSANAASPFSAVSTSKAESSPFGSPSFGSGPNEGGGFLSGLGSKPNTESANKNVFGSTSVSSSTPQTSLFGGSSGSSSPFQGSVFGGGGASGSTGTSSFSTGGGPAASVGFAVTSPQTPGFGGAATFGGSPSFGATTTFGSPPRIASPGSVFGGSSTFSSPLTSSTGGGFSSFASLGGSTFGSVAGSATSTASSGFGNFANQSNAASFGSLAQQNPTQQSSGELFGSGGSSFGSGSSFSTWR